VNRGAKNTVPKGQKRFAKGEINLIFIAWVRSRCCEGHMS